MYIIWILIWWASICHAFWMPGYHPVCLDAKAWKMPEWYLPTTPFIAAFSKGPRPYRHPLNKGLIEGKALPADIVLPHPLMPTDDPDTQKLYHEAIMVVVEDDASSTAEKNLAQDIFAQDTACWNLQVECQESGWMLSWPWWSCETQEQVTNLYNWYSPESVALDTLTISLLKRSYRYALLDLGHQLVPLIKNNGGYYGRLKRADTDPNEPIPGLVIPKYAQNVELLVKFYRDPFHRAEHRDVREPHLPGHIVPPTPLLSTIDNVFNATDKTLVNIYKDALKAYDEDQKLSDSDIRQRWQQHMENSWNWIVRDPCYYDRNTCNIYSYFDRIFGIGWFEGHIAEGEGYKKAMEHNGLAKLGVQLLLEAMQSRGSQTDLQRLLSEYVD